MHSKLLFKKIVSNSLQSNDTFINIDLIINAFTTLDCMVVRITLLMGSQNYKS